MRRNFAQILASVQVDLESEYQKLYDMFYCGDELYGVVYCIQRNFSSCQFRGCCLTFEEFNETYGFRFERHPRNFNEDYFISFCEYAWNLLHSGIKFGYINRAAEDCDEKIRLLLDKIGYTQGEQNGFTIFVKKSPEAVAVAESEMIPQELSYKLISYNHHSMKGNLQEKKNTIRQLADLLEPKRETLTRADKSLSSDLFYLFNNLNLRHNNTDPAGKNYKKAVADMAPEELEQWYDETYQMCLLAFMQLEQAERKAKFDELKVRIERK